MDKAPMRVLLVASEAEDRTHIRHLVGDDYRLIEAPSGFVALELFDAEAIDCVLLDGDLPDYDGLELVDKLVGGLRNVAVVMLCGDERRAVEAMKRGVHDCLVKGECDAETLRAALAGAIKRAADERQTRQRQQELEQFVWTAAHDLKAPLHNIYYMIETTKLTELQKLDDSVLDCFEQVAGQINRLSRLVDNLLDYSRTGQEDKPLVPVELDGVMEQVLAHLAANIREQDARFQIEPMPTVQGDEVSLVQLFQNLIGNALKFRGEAAPVVQVSAAPTEGRWKISVHDNGIGIDPAFHREIFAPLRRLNRPGRFEGHGLGLAICRKIIERHRGNIWVDSTPGQGTTFSLTLPGVGPVSTRYRVP